MNPPAPTPTYMFVFRNAERMGEQSPAELKHSFQLWTDWISKMQAQGQYLGGDPLEDLPAKVVRGKSVIEVTDGPYAEATEAIGGYMLIRTPTFAEAVELSRGCPGLLRGGCVEVRQLMPRPSEKRPA